MGSCSAPPHPQRLRACSWLVATACHVGELRRKLCALGLDEAKRPVLPFPGRVVRHVIPGCIPGRVQIAVQAGREADPPDGGMVALIVEMAYIAAAEVGVVHTSVDSQTRELAPSDTKR